MKEGLAAVLFYSFLALVLVLVAWQLNRLRKPEEVDSKGGVPKEPEKPKTKAELAAEHETAERERKAVLDAYYERMLATEEFVNKNAESLDDFIINEELNHFDLEKLAQLNGIMVGIDEGWYSLALDLMRELDAEGWDRRVGTIKEKYGEMRFYAETRDNDLLDRYAEASTHICEYCGKPGYLDTSGGWWITRCEEHHTAAEDV